MFELKEYLNLSDIAELFNQNGYNYDVNELASFYSLKHGLIDLVKECKVRPYFYSEPATTEMDFTNEYFQLSIQQFLELYNEDKIIEVEGVFFPDSAKPVIEYLKSFKEGEETYPAQKILEKIQEDVGSFTFIQALSEAGLLKDTGELNTKVKMP